MITQTQGVRVHVRPTLERRYMDPRELREEARAADIAIEAASEIGTYLFVESTVDDPGPKWCWRDCPPSRFARLP